MGPLVGVRRLMVMPLVGVRRLMMMPLVGVRRLIMMPLVGVRRLILTVLSPGEYPDGYCVLGDIVIMRFILN